MITRRILFYKVISILIVGCYCAVEPLNQNSFPDQFLFGVSSASYQIEGAWKVDGKGENIWDRFTQQYPEKIADGSNGNIACDSYYKYKEDVQLIKALGVSFYRFSLSWARILPTGFVNEINPEGIKYYNNLINELIANNITPMVTMYHWDLPQPLQDIGGWPNPALIDIFVDFANVVFREFGDRVKTWITFNEPKQICKLGYGDGRFAPGLSSSGVGDYLCAYGLLIAHAKAYHLYNNTYRSTQRGIVGITVHVDAYIPGSNSSEDIAAAQRDFEFLAGIYTEPIFGKGDYPQVVKDFVADRSSRQGFSSSRLPPFTEEEVQLLKGTSDFYGLNYYSAMMVDDAEEQPLSVVSTESDIRVVQWYHEDWPPAAGASWQRVVPFGLRRVLKHIKDTYGDVPIYITENGYSDRGGLQDHVRVNYILSHLSACLDAIYEDNVNLVAYTAWTLMDNFEWIEGYIVRFGIHDVDFNDPERTRTRKLSADYYTNVVRNRKLPEATVEVPQNATTSSTTTDGSTTEGFAISQKPLGVPLLVAIIITVKTML